MLHLSRIYIFLFCCFLTFVSAASSLRILTENLPPYQIVHKGKVIGGTSVKIMKEVLKRARLKVKFEVMPWARAYKIASSEPNVLIFSMARNKGRETNFHWLINLKPISYRLFKLADQNTTVIRSLKEALNYTVVTVRNSYEANSLIDDGFVEGSNLILTNNYEQAWKMLLKGRVDYVYAYELVESSMYKKLEITPDSFTKSLYIGETSGLYIAANIDISSEILKKLQTAIQSMQDDGTLKTLTDPSESTITLPVYY
jgi:polar amino acid transport system substrate-binding protein